MEGARGRQGLEGPKGDEVSPAILTSGLFAHRPKRCLKACFDHIRELWGLKESKVQEGKRETL